jgi:glucose/arabinose dehydrogenase
VTAPRKPCALALAALLAAAATGLAGCSFGAPPPDQAGEPPRLPTPSVSPSPQGGGDSGGAIDVIAKGLAVPWGVAFLPDGTGLVTERDSARILKIGPAPGASAAPSRPAAPSPAASAPPQADSLVVTPVQTLTGVTAGGSAGDGGLLGIAVSPNYATDQTVFVYYSTAQDNRIASLKLGSQPTPLVTGIPHGSSDNGGGLAFGPDGLLYATTGDAGTPTAAADPKSLAGKVLRMGTDGKPAPGNPGGTLVYASGLHDPQGLAWDGLKHLFVADPGSNWDEINLIQPGKNYGWPAVEGPAGNASYVDPTITVRPAQGGCAGLGITGNLMLTGCLAGTRLYEIGLTAAGGTLGAAQPMLQGKYGRLRTVVRAPDGSFWVTTSNKDGHGQPTADDDRILRIVLGGSAAGLT